ncbi:uncharacterized protein CTRU02_210383 [Colletotrichum truncatum]|uniref:Uncharacterized protein n=1 Tax=Colletotrichum truncatum TaxID=5467 RepID=A0ACC3YNX0_COLTU|nr:uncharacterized protein CTRU02_15368 [Colletotrichum truncatum]KAF6781151.1 hypothetical protein CTRU02_15368 [Colletotrichum truncatum]
MRTSNIVAILASVSTVTALALPVVDAPAAPAVEDRQVTTTNAGPDSFLAKLVDINNEVVQVRLGVTGLEGANFPSRTTGLSGLLASLGLDQVFNKLLNDVLRPLFARLSGGGGLQTTFGSLLSQLQDFNATGQGLSLDQSQQIISQLTSFQGNLQQVLDQFAARKPDFTAISGGAGNSVSIFNRVQTILGGVLGLGNGNVGTALDGIRSFLTQTLLNSNLLTGSNSVLLQRIDPSLRQTLEGLSSSLQTILNSSINLYAK